MTMIFGQTVSDPYRWLENANSPRTQQWIDAQNARAEGVLAKYGGRKDLVDRVRQLALTGPQQFSPQLAGGTLFFMRETPPQPQPLLMASAWPSGTPRVIADPSRFGATASIDYVWPSPSGRYVAIGVSQAGSESATIHVLDTRTSHWFDESLAPCGGGTTSPSVAWDGNERSFTYTRLPSNGSQFGIKLYHHTLGTPQSSDTLALDAISPIAEYDLMTSSDAREGAALVQFGDGSTYRVYARNGKQWKSLIGPSAGIVSGSYVGTRLFVVATGDSPRGRIAAVEAGGTLTTVVPQAPQWAYHQVAPIRNGFLVVKSWGTVWRVDHYDRSGRFIRTVALPQQGIGIRDIASDDAHDTAVIDYSGWAGPADRWISYNGTTGSIRTLYDVPLPSNNYSNVRVREIVATSKDGTKIPVTVLALASTKPDGNAPTILTGYGGFRLSTQPYFIGANLAWLERGGVYAVANLRGGSEYGEAWHRAGMLTNKQNVFDDFYASAQALVANGWTKPSRLGIEGGSNGGLLVGAALVQHPQEYRAVVGAAGIYDTLRHHIFPNGAYNVSEYGSVDDRAQFHALYEYSPYHHVTRGVRYPAVLLITSENDPRVASWQSWKFGAALEASTASSYPVIVVTHRTGGHGHGATFAQRVGNQSLMLSFLAQQLGVASTP